MMMEYPTPLPDNPFTEGGNREAYDECLALETVALESHIGKLNGCPEAIACARLLGHLLRLAPAGNAQDTIQREIRRAKSQQMLMQLAGHYANTFIREFRRSSGPTPRPSEHPSRPSFEDARSYAAVFMEERTLDNRTARAAAMLRDNHCCMLTGGKDAEYGGTTLVQTAHIIPASVNKNIEAKRFHSAGIWAILAIGDLAGNRINRLDNILSLNAILHGFFDNLRLWLKPVEDKRDTYLVYTHPERIKIAHSLPDVVAFTTSKKDLPLPDRDFLALHALCCEVAWMSGMAEYIMDIERRMDDTKVLARDGSSFDLLMAALSFVKPIEVGSY